MDLDNYQTYEDLKYLSKAKLEEVLNTFQCVKIPLTQKESEFIYFRKYPVDQLGKFHKSEQIQEKKKDLDLNIQKKETVFTKTKVIKYKNPYEEKQLSKQEKFEDTSKKIVSELPRERTLLVVSKDRNYEDDQLKEIFQVFGKVRRVFNMKLKKKINKQNMTKFFYILIFKHEKSLVKCFDTRSFQWEVMKKRMPTFSKMSENEKEVHFQQYYQSIREHLDNMEEQEVKVTEGYELAARTNDDYDKLFEELRGEKKQKKKIHEGYYQFASHHNMSEKQTYRKKKNEIKMDSDLDEAQLDNPDYLKKRKQKLADDFKEIKKLKNNQ